MIMLKELSRNAPLRISSSAKSTPAMGALKFAAIAPAEPHATRTFSLSLDILTVRPTEEPIAPPIWATGPSHPAEPPEPMVIAEVMSLLMMTLPRITAPLRFTLSRNVGNP